jgi:hypothetical protein
MSKKLASPLLSSPLLSPLSLSSPATDSCYVYGDIYNKSDFRNGLIRISSALKKKTDVIKMAADS